MKRLLEALLRFLNSRKRRILTFVLTVVTTVTACTAGTSSTSAAANEPIQLNSENTTLTVVFDEKGIYTTPASPTLLQQQQRTVQKLNRNATRIKATVKLLKGTVGKTWYVFSGATPSGWDCSGLVVWFYEQMGVTLEHSATKQLHSGKHVKNPKVGDIVAFSYPGSSQSFHVGIYVGDGKVIHAYYYGKRTVIQKVSDVQKENGGAKVTYVRILPSSSPH